MTSLRLCKRPASERPTQPWEVHIRDQQYAPGCELRTDHEAGMELDCFLSHWLVSICSNPAYLEFV